MRANDARVDARGRLWVRTVDWHEENALGELFVVGLNGQIRSVASSLVVSNGLDFSDDGRTLYHIDSGLRAVHAYTIIGS